MKANCRENDRERVQCWMLLDYFGLTTTCQPLNQMEQWPEVEQHNMVMLLLLKVDRWLPGCCPSLFHLIVLSVMSMGITTTSFASNFVSVFKFSSTTVPPECLSRCRRAPDTHKVGYEQGTISFWFAVLKLFSKWFNLFPSNLSDVKIKGEIYENSLKIWGWATKVKCIY